MGLRLSLARAHGAAHHQNTTDNSGERRSADRAGQQPFPSVRPGHAITRIVSRTEEVSGPLGLTRELRRSASALTRHRPKRGAQAQPRCKRGWPPAIPGREGADGTNGRERGMILSILVTLAFVATLLWMLVRAFTSPMRHQHRRPVH
jgi:hypothetical protein